MRISSASKRRTVPGREGRWGFAEARAAKWPGGRGHILTGANHDFADTRVVLRREGAVPAAEGNSLRALPMPLDVFT